MDITYYTLAQLNYCCEYFNVSPLALAIGCQQQAVTKIVIGCCNTKQLQEIRLGEKLHEIMCPADDSYHTYQYDDHFFITPSIIFYSRSNDFTVNALAEKGHQVEHGFEYNSKNNPAFLTPEQLLTFNATAEL